MKRFEYSQALHHSIMRWVYTQILHLLKWLKHHSYIVYPSSFDYYLTYRNPSYINLSKSSSSTQEGVFKNAFIDIIKPKKDEAFKNKCDANKKVLDEERYTLTYLEDEILPSKQPTKLFGLEPFEMAEFRVGKLFPLS
jgi:hypothetical protein